MAFAAICGTNDNISKAVIINNAVFLIIFFMNRHLPYINGAGSTAGHCLQNNYSSKPGSPPWAPVSPTLVSI